MERRVVGSNSPVYSLTTVEQGPINTCKSIQMKLNLRNIVIPLWLVALASTDVYAQSEQLSGLEDQQSVAVTIYNDNLALVKDQRKIALESGRQSVAIRDVSAQIRPETVLLTTTDGGDAINILEQNFDFDLLTPESLLGNFVGESVRAVSINPATGNETTEEAVVLATNNGVVLKFPDRIETQFPGRLIFEDVPNRLRDRPTLVVDLQSTEQAERQIELSYLTGGLGWQANYVARLKQSETSFDMSGWVTLTNQSGTTYSDAVLQLVAGDVQQVPSVQLGVHGTTVLKSAMAADAFAEESLLDYHLYSLDRATTIADRQTKQVTLMSANNVPVTKQYLLTGNGNFLGGKAVDSIKQDVGVYLALTNSKQSNLGIPLPAGVVRVYKNDSAGRIQFVGEDRIDHTPKNADMQLKLGNAFDVTAERIQISFKRVKNKGSYNFSAEIGQKIVLKNATDNLVTVTVREFVPGDWQILAETGEHRKLAANSVEWLVRAPANDEVDLEYVALVRY